MIIAKGGFGLSYLAATTLATVLLAGCTSPGYRKSDAVALSMKNASLEIRTEGEELDRTMESLNGLAGQPEADMKISFERFSDSLKRLQAAAKRTDATGRRMSQKGSAYFDNWERQLEAIDYQHVRDLSLSRRTEVTNRFATIDRRYQESQAAVGPLIVYLKDLRTALGTDLTPAGVEALKGVIQNAETSAKKVRDALQSLSNELANSSSTFASYAQRQSEAEVDQQ